MNLASVTGNAVQRSRLADRDRRTETEQVIKQAVAFVVAEDSGGDVVNFTPVVFRDQRSLVNFQRAPSLGGNVVLVNVEGFALHQQLIPCLLDLVMFSNQLFVKYDHAHAVAFPDLRTFTSWASAPTVIFSREKKRTWSVAGVVDLASVPSPAETRPSFSSNTSPAFTSMW